MTKCMSCGKEIATDEKRFLQKASGERLTICCIQCGQDMADPGSIIYILGEEKLWARMEKEARRLTNE